MFYRMFVPSLLISMIGMFHMLLLMSGNLRVRMAVWSLLALLRALLLSFLLLRLVLLLSPLLLLLLCLLLPRSLVRLLRLLLRLPARSFCVLCLLLLRRLLPRPGTSGELIRARIRLLLGGPSSFYWLH